MQLLGFSDLVRRFAAQARASATITLDFTVGSVMRALAEANAALGLWLQWLILIVLRQTRLATCQADECDTFGADFGFARLPASAAGGHAVFARITPGITAVIPLGTTVRTADGGQSFSVVADSANAAWNGSGYTIASGASSVTIPVAAVTPGAAGNIEPGSLSVLTTALAGVDSVSNSEQFSGGIDAESDAALRDRFVLFVNSRTRGTADAFGYAIASYRQGLDYAIAENIDVDGSDRPGFVTVTVDDGTGAPPSSLLDGLYAAIDTIRPLTVAFAVRAPTVVTATITVTITAKPGYSKPTLIGPVTEAILTYIGGLGVGVSLPYSMLGALAFSVPGVANAYAITANGGTADLGGGARQVVRASNATVTVA